MQIDFFDFYCWKSGIADSGTFFLSREGQEMTERILGFALEKSYFGIYLAVFKRDLSARKIMLD